MQLSARGKRHDLSRTQARVDLTEGEPWMAADHHHQFFPVAVGVWRGGTAARREDLDLRTQRREAARTREIDVVGILGLAIRRDGRRAREVIWLEQRHG